MKKSIFFPCLAAAAVLFSGSALAASKYEGMAHPWELNFQNPATPVMERLYDMHSILLWIITGITLLVLAVLLIIIARFNRRANPVPSKTTHNTLLEIIWTAIPIMILIGIAAPSLKLHYYMQRIVDPDMTLKVVGYQWYWHYEYPDQGGFGYDSYIKKKDLLPGEHRMLAVDNHVVVPVNTKVRVLVTGGDVIHSWAVPAFGVKRDAVPGRLNETWFEASKIGTFYGQCSELCGVGHGFMPIVIDVVSKDDFNAWVKKKQDEADVKPDAKAPLEKETTPVTPAVSGEHANPAPVIEKEKETSKPGAVNNNPAAEKPAGNPNTIGKENQPKPAKAAEKAPKATPDTQDDNSNDDQ